MDRSLQKRDRVDDRGSKVSIARVLKELVERDESDQCTRGVGDLVGVHSYHLLSLPTLGPQVGGSDDDAERTKEYEQLCLVEALHLWTNEHR